MSSISKYPVNPVSGLYDDYLNELSWHISYFKYCSNNEGREEAMAQLIALIKDKPIKKYFERYRDNNRLFGSPKSQETIQKLDNIVDYMNDINENNDLAALEFKILSNAFLFYLAGQEPFFTDVLDSELIAENKKAIEARFSNPLYFALEYVVQVSR